VSESLTKTFSLQAFHELSEFTNGEFHRQ
jgi:hypothetical protein